MYNLKTKQPVLPDGFKRPRPFSRIPEWSYGVDPLGDEYIKGITSSFDQVTSDARKWFDESELPMS